MTHRGPLVRGAEVTIRVLSYRGDGAYYLGDPAHELDDVRAGPPGRDLRGERPAAAALTGLLDAGGATGAIDVVVAAPKPVSVLLALEPPAVARRVVALHERSVASALAYLEEEGLAGLAPGMVGFTHGINRHCDPHLHTHVLVGTRTAEGDPVPSPRLQRHARTADALYLAEVRAGLVAAAGRRAWCSTRGTVLVEGVDAGLVAAASEPRARDGRVQRGAAKTHPAQAAVRSHWEALVASSSIGLLPVPPAPSDTIDEYRFARELGSGLVGRREVVAALAAACTEGSSAEDVRASASRLAPGAEAGRVRAAAVTDPVGVRTLGPRPVAPSALSAWVAARGALARYLDDGHPLRFALDPRGASPSTQLAVAELDVARAALVGPATRGRDVGRSAGRGLS